MANRNFNSNASSLPNSSRHMNRSEAEMIIRFNLSEHCYFDRPQDWDKSVYDTLETMGQKMGHNLGFMQFNDQYFQRFMQLCGAMYWDREFDRCCRSMKLNGTDSVPYAECILPVSVILKPSNTYGEYGIITDPYFLWMATCGLRGVRDRLRKDIVTILIRHTNIFLTKPWLSLVLR